MDLETAAIQGIEQAAAAAAKPPETEGDKPAETPEPPAPPPKSEPDEDAEEPEPEPPPPTVTEIADDMRVKIGDQELTGADIKGGLMRLGDYRQKTAELARERDTIKGERASWDQERAQWKDYLRALFSDPSFLTEELDQYGPGTLDKALNAHADELIKREGMTAEARSAWDEAKKREREVKRREREIERRERERLAQETKGKQADVAARYAKVVPDALKTAGLLIDGDTEHSKAMVRLLQGELMATHGPAEYTDQQIQEAASALSETPAVKALLREKKGQQAGVDELVKSLGPERVREILKHEAAKTAGTRPPAAPTVSEPQPRDKTKKSAVSIGQYFDKIRDQFDR